jgi:aquaporin Z
VAGLDSRPPGSAPDASARPQDLRTLAETLPMLDSDVAARALVTFWDGAYEYRRLFAETWGTFLLVLVAAGGGVVGALPVGGDITLLMKVLAPGLMVVAIIYFMGTVSGAHINPAVTLAFAARGHFPWRRVPGYLIAQVVGAVLASLVLEWLYGGIGNGRTVPAAGIEPWVAVVTEVLLTLGLLSVVFGTADGPRNVGHNSALAIGFYVALAGMWAAAIDGASMNPARSFGPDLVALDLSQTWIYVVGPIVGALAAVLFDRLVHGPPAEAGRAAAQGLLASDDPDAL